MPGKVSVNVSFTGICTYVPDKKNGETAPEVTFVMPNGRGWNSAPSGSGLIPPHNVFILTKLENVVHSNGRFVGIAPTGSVLDHVYWRVDDSEIVLLGQDENAGVTFGDTTHVVRIGDVCPDGVIDSKYLGGLSAVVAARMRFRSGTLSESSTTEDQFTFTRCDETTRAADLIADEVTVSVDVEPEQDGVVIGYEPFAGGMSRIVLQPKRMRVYVVNAPEGDLMSVFAEVPNHAHGNTNHHFELYYKLGGKALTRFPAPELDSRPAMPPTAGTDGCPPTANGGG